MVLAPTVMYEALKSKNIKFEITSLETDKIALKNILKNLKVSRNYFNIRTNCGRRVARYKQNQFQKHNLISENIEWFHQDIRRYKKTRNILEDLDNNYDFILFDGGEFSTFAEFKKLFKRTKYFALDDVDTYKQYDVLSYINKHKEKFLLISQTNGLCIYKNIN